MKDPRNKRADERKFRRIPVRFGLEAPDFRGVGIQISTRGLFISTNHRVYAPGSKIMIEIPTPRGSYTLAAIVRHAKKVPHILTHYERAGMGVEFISPPQELQDFLASL